MKLFFRLTFSDLWAILYSMSNPAVDDLQSSQARGQIGHDSVYYVRLGTQCKRAYIVPVQPNTQAQLDARQLFADGMTYWKNQNQAYRDAYNERVKNPFRKMWGVNLFIREWILGIIP